MQQGFGYGQLDPSRDMNSDHNALMFHIRQELSRINVMKVVQVEAVDTGLQTVDVLPLVSQIDGQGNVTPHGTVHGLPYFRLQAGQFAVICDPQVGDMGLAICSDRDISGVKSNKAQSPPTCFRSYDIADGVYIGGILNGAPTQYIQFTQLGIKLVGNVIIQGNLQLSGAIQAVDGTTYQGNLSTGGNVIAGAGTGSSVGLKTHTHQQGADSHGDTEQATNSPTGGT
jgi:Phage protein Gp138 N-terminal domain